MVLPYDPQLVKRYGFMNSTFVSEQDYEELLDLYRQLQREYANELLKDKELVAV